MCYTCVASLQWYSLDAVHVDTKNNVEKYIDIETTKTIVFKWFFKVMVNMFLK